MAYFIVPASVVTAALLLTLVFAYVIYSSINHSYWKRKGVPYVQPIPIVGSLWNVFSGKIHLGIELGNLYKQFAGPYFGIYVLDKPYLVLRDADLIKRILIKDFSIFSHKNFACDPKADSLAATSLFIIKNPDWKALRAQLTPAFSSGKMKMMLPIMNECGLDLQKHLHMRASSESTEMKEVCARFTTDLIASCVFGIKARSLQENDSEFRKAAKRMFSCSVQRSFQFFTYLFAPKLVSIFKVRFIDPLSADFLTRVFMDTMRLRENPENRRNDLVDTLMSVSSNTTSSFTFDAKCMVSQAITFFTAGYETTSNLIVYSLYELCLHQDMQEKLRSEILDKIKHNGVTYEAIQEMQYLHMVVLETLRKYPFGTFLKRHCDENYLVEETGFVIEKGISVVVPLFGLHYDEQYFPNPQQFDPERFDDENKKILKTGVYLPFGEGPRNCIGERFGILSGKVGLIYFLSKFRVEKCKETPDAVAFNPKSPFLAPIGGLLMRIVEI